MEIKIEDENEKEYEADFLKPLKPIRATVAKEAGQRMSTEETAVRPDQKLYVLLILLVSVSAALAVYLSDILPQ